MSLNIERDARTNTATLPRDTELTDDRDPRDPITATANANAADDFFSDAPLDADNAVTGKTCNVWDPECEACQ